MEGEKLFIKYLSLHPLCEPEAFTFEKRECSMEFETAEFVRLIHGGEGNRSHICHSVNTLAVMDKARELTDTKFE